MILNNLSHNLEVILEEIVGELQDSCFDNFERLVTSGKLDLTESCTLWAFNRIANDVTAYLGIDGYRVYPIPDNFPPESVVLLRHQNKLSRHD